VCERCIKLLHQEMHQAVPATAMPLQRHLTSFVTCDLANHLRVSLQLHYPTACRHVKYMSHLDSSRMFLKAYLDTLYGVVQSHKKRNDSPAWPVSFGIPLSFRGTRPPLSACWFMMPICLPSYFVFGLVLTFCINSTRERGGHGPPRLIRAIGQETGEPPGTFGSHPLRTLSLHGDNSAMIHEEDPWPF